MQWPQWLDWDATPTVTDTVQGRMFFVCLWGTQLDNLGDKTPTHGSRLEGVRQFLEDHKRPRFAAQKLNIPSKNGCSIVHMEMFQAAGDVGHDSMIIFGEIRRRFIEYVWL